MPEDIQVITQVIVAKEAPKRIVEVIDRYVAELSEEYKKNPVFVRKSFVVEVDEKFEIEAGERAAIRWVSTIDVDRDREILMPDGCRLTEFRKAPQVLWGHNYRMPPIGRDAWIKKWPKDNPKGILAKTIYAMTPMAEEIWSLVSGGFLRTSSVGFIPLKSVRSGEQGFDKLCDKIEQIYGTNLGDRSKLRKIYTDWLLLEHSDVSVPANINALTVAVGKGLELSEELLEELGIEKSDIEAAGAVDKGVIPFKDLGTVPEGTAWNGAREVRLAEVDDLKLMCTWYDSANPDIKGSYKLPHHLKDGKKCVWRAVAASMGILLGARGGVDVPSGDKKGIHSHLSKHYKQFDKETPELREYGEDELKQQFPEEVWLSLWEDVLKPFPNEHACRVNDPGKYTSFARDNNKFGPGIHAIWGIKEGKSELQSVRFDKSKYSAAEAKKWCIDHNYKCKPFEPAAPPKGGKEPIVRTAPVIKMIEPKKKTIVKTEVVIKEIKKSIILPIVREEPESIEKMTEKEIGRRLGRV